MVGLSSTLALARDGQVYRLDEHAAGGSRPAGNARVHVALSFHVNLYHSYRGDSNTDDGYGIDLDVMRNTLDWLDRHPRARADWDLETHFSLGEGCRPMVQTSCPACNTGSPAASTKSVPCPGTTGP